MIILANDREIQVNSVQGEKISRDGRSYPALRFEFSNAINAEDVEALMCGVFNILDDDGNLLGIHEGYNTKGSLSVVIGKITTAEQERNEIAATLATTQQEKTELQEALSILLEGGN